MDWFNVSGYRNLQYMSFDLSLYKRRNGFIECVLPTDFTVQRIDEADRGLIRGPSLRFDLDTAQNLFQEMWNQGYRPANGSAGASEVEALKAHIAFAEKIALRNR